MRKVIGIGETVLDIIFKNGKPVSALPGGSTFNAMISLGRSGVKTNFISETGNDRVGEHVIDFMKDNGISTENVSVFSESKTPLALAFLDDQNNADYVFYKDHPHDQLEFSFPEVNRDDIVLFGSFFAVNPAVRSQVACFLDMARKHGAILYYDVNYRLAHKNELLKITPNLLDNLDYADIVRGSHEDFDVIYNMPDPDKVYHAEISFYCKKFICTQGHRPIEVRAEDNFRKSYSVADTKTVSTVGAGDNFNAGFIYGMLKNNITRDNIEEGFTEKQWDSLVESAQRFSSECCKDIYNYISPDFGKRMKKEAQE